MPGVNIDAPSRAKLRLVYPDLAVRVVRVFQDMGVLHGRGMRVSEGVRTIEYQARLYAQGRTSPGPVVTFAKPGDSHHHYGCALDACFTGPDPYLAKMKTVEADFLWKEFGRLAQAHGLVWGGIWDKFMDRPHVQSTYGFTLREIQAFYKHGGMTGVWMAFDKKRGVPPGDGWYGPQTRVRCLEMGQISPTLGDSQGGETT